MFPFNSNEPIWKQIDDDIKSKIVSGYYSSNQQIESVRELAGLYGVNPNTIVKSLSVLENDGILRTERGIGKFINMDEQQIVQLKIEYATKVIADATTTLKKMNVDLDTVLELFRKEMSHE